MKFRFEFVGVALLCVAFGSEALTLGRVRGAVLVGHPLKVVIPIQMDAGEDVASLCFDAEVFHADTRQEARRVQVLVEPTVQAHVANVRVLSSTVVDEPVVTVYLHAGCGQKTTRRYVLLADFPSEVAAPTAPLPVVPVAALPPVPGGLAPVVSGPASASPLASHAVPVVKVKAKKIRVPTPSVRPEVVTKRPEVKAAVAVATRTQSRLKLDPLELFSDRVAETDASMTFTPPEDALRTMQQMQTLQGDVKALLAAASKNEASLVDLKARLQKAESERFPAEIIYGLIALVLACLAAIGFLWTRQRRVHAGGDDWWSGATVPVTAPPEPMAQPLPEPVAAPDQSGDRLASKKAPAAATSHFSVLASEPAVRLMEVSESDFDNLMQPRSIPRAKREQPPPPSPAAVTQGGALRKLNSEAVLDIRQQAEFFVSLGQTERAARILKKQIDEGDEPNPLVYLDLLNLFHSLSLKVDFQLLRKDFNLLFNGRVPEFALFKNEGHGLEFYSELLSRITALWPTPKVLEVIEACIFQDPWDTKEQSLDLAAFRDLLMLHAIAQTVVLAHSSEIDGRPAGSSEMTASSPALDLDLSDLGIEDLATSSVQKAADDASPSVDMEDLLDFELPKLPPS